MKRALYVVWLMTVMTLAGAPLSFVPGSGLAQVQPVQAAECEFVESADGKPTSKCANGSGLASNSKDCPNGVRIGLPILTAGEQCISNDAGSGGAIVAYLKLILRLLGSAVGLLIVTLIVVSGVQYIASTGDPARVKSAKDRLQNAIIGLVLYLSMFAILTFLVPGGIL